MNVNLHYTNKMAMNLKDLCRLCAAKDEFSKDLLDESNKNVLKMIQDIIQIFIYENDNLPTKICLNCEDKMVSFQLFVLECYKVQDTLRKMYVDDLCDLQIKLEQQQALEIETNNSSVIKSEVKDEMTAEDIVTALKNEGTLTEISLYEDDNHHDGDDHQIDDDDDDDLDNVAIATLKQIKKQQVKQKIKSKIDPEKLNNILKTSNFKVKDLVKFECVLCSERLKSWSHLRLHYATEHKSEPVVICLCGYEIKSKSILYKHVSDHKLESKKMNNIVDSDDEKQGPIDSKYSKLNVKDFVRFTCRECEKECSSWYSLKSHSQYKHNTLPTVQCSCGITLKSKSVMYKHIQDHKSPNVLACDKCPRITKTIEALDKHKLRHVPKSERKYTCESCDKIFTTRDALKSHERSHIPIEDRKIYHCEVCNLKFTTRSSAASHKRVVHDKIKGYVCDLCGYACGTGGELRQHRAIHSEDKPFTCRTCSKSFKTYSNLKTHMDTHEDTSYECYICRRVLNSRRTLRKHLLVHEDKCRHVCSYCNKAFKRRQTLKVHMYTHTGDKPLTCKWCEERFAYASTLRSHRLRCHPDKMAAQTHAAAAHATHYQPYGEHTAMQQTYIKNDAVAVSVPVAKNEVEAM